jgi:hypothetical protein
VNSASAFFSSVVTAFGYSARTGESVAGVCAGLGVHDLVERGLHRVNAD